MNKEYRKTLQGFIYGILGAAFFLLLIAVVYIVFGEIQPYIDYYMDQGTQKIVNSQIYNDIQYMVSKLMERINNFL